MANSTIIFFLTKLAHPENGDEYERWVREVDIPSVMAWPCTIDYRVVKLEQPALEGVDAPDYDYIEIMEVTSLPEYQTALQEAPPSLFEAFATHIGPFQAVSGSVVQ